MDIVISAFLVHLAIGICCLVYVLLFKRHVFGSESTADKFDHAEAIVLGGVVSLIYLIIEECKDV